MEKEKYSLVGIDGNAFAIMGYVSSSMSHEQFKKKEIDEYIADAKSFDYYHLLQVSIDYIERCNARANGQI